MPPQCPHCQKFITSTITSGACYPYPGRLVGGQYVCNECADRLIAAAKAVQYPINGHCPRCGAPVYGPAEAHAFRDSYCSGDGYYPMNLVSYGCSCRYQPVTNVVKLDDQQLEELKTYLTINLAPKLPEPKRGWW